MGPHTTLLRRDVRGLSAEEVLDACGLKVGELDVFDGSPPCEPFSMAGRRDATWRDVQEYSGQHQRTDDLFLEFARLVKGVQPRCFVAENVTGLVKGRAKGYFKIIMAALRACGYRVAARVLDAAWLGVPQSRQRVIIIGVRADLAHDPAFPAPLSYQYTVWDAIGDSLTGSDTVRHSGYDMKASDVSGEVSPTIMSCDSGHWHIEGANGFDGHAFQATDQPGRTVQASRTLAVEQEHDGERRRRKLSIAELIRICGFPDDYVLTGTFAQQWERLGDSVPPPMAAAWASAIKPRKAPSVD